MRQFHDFEIANYKKHVKNNGLQTAMCTARRAHRRYDLLIAGTPTGNGTKGTKPKTVMT